jgi:hypothetical protein
MMRESLKMTYPMMQHIPLKSAYLCQDCNCIGNCPEQCPACASSVLMNLSCILDREPETVAAAETRSVPRFYPHPVGELTAMVA